MKDNFLNFFLKKMSNYPSLKFVSFRQTSVSCKMLCDKKWKTEARVERIDGTSSLKRNSIRRLMTCSSGTSVCHKCHTYHALYVSFVNDKRKTSNIASAYCTMHMEGRFVSCFGGNLSAIHTLNNA